MFGLSYGDILEKIKKESGLKETDIELKVREKLKKLSNLISKEGAAHIVANELGIKLVDFDFKINKLKKGMNSVSIVAKVLNIYGINEYKKVREGKVANLLIGDDSGIIKLVLWDSYHVKLIEDGKLKENDIIKIRNGYVKDNNGFNELHLGSRGQIVVNPEGVSVEVVGKKQLPVDYQRKSVEELNVGDVAGVFGTIVQIFEPRFYDACPECGRKVNEGRCDEHGAVSSVDVPILNLFFDDGTDNIRVVAFRDQVEKLLDLNREQVLKFKEDISEFEKYKSDLLGKQLVIVGRVTKNEMFDRKEFTAQRVIEVRPEDMIKEFEEVN